LRTAPSSTWACPRCSSERRLGRGGGGGGGGQPSRPQGEQQRARARAAGTRLGARRAQPESPGPSSPPPRNGAPTEPRCPPLPPHRPCPLTPPPKAGRPGRRPGRPPGAGRLGVPPLLGRPRARWHRGGLPHRQALWVRGWSVGLRARRGWAAAAAVVSEGGAAWHGVPSPTAGPPRSPAPPPSPPPLPHRRLSADEALERVQRAFDTRMDDDRRSPETEEQRQLVRTYVASLGQ
jgi:hypothetical protein